LINYLSWVTRPEGVQVPRALVMGCTPGTEWATTIFPFMLDGDPGRRCSLYQIDVETEFHQPQYVKYKIAGRLTRVHVNSCPALRRNLTMLKRQAKISSQYKSLLVNMEVRIVSAVIIHLTHSPQPRLSPSKFAVLPVNCFRQPILIS
jgi:hypothetical protein